jgi:diguanylate cyclase (GGDEF)-like protein
VFADRVAARPWRTYFSVSWTALSAFAVVAVADLDGGLGSPLVFLLFLPISYAGWAFTPGAAAACGASSLISLGIVASTSRYGPVSGHIGLLMFAVLAGSSVLSVAAARNRARRERHEAELTAQIAELAATDGLTGCAVRRVFFQRLKVEVERSSRHGLPLSLAMIDVDEFKKINDSFGHLMGDHVLANIGAGLRTHSRASDLVARLGGDEFAMLMPQTLPSVAVEVVSRIRDGVVSGLRVPATLSIGISGLDPDAPSVERLLDDADFALYEVKESGRDSIAVRDVTGSRRPAAGAHD